MLKKIFFICFVFAFQGTGAQSLIDSLSSLRFTMQDTVGEELVKLAMNNPAIKVIDEQIEAGRYEYDIQRAGWLNNFNASFNLNEGNLKGTSSTETIGFYPRYNFNLSIPLGHIITRKKSAQKARSQYEEVIQRKEVQKAELREAVLVTYQEYLMNKYLLSLQEEVIQDEKTVFDLVEQRFKTNNVTLEAFAVASKKFNDALVRRISLLRDVNVSRYQLESLIGMPLEQAFAMIEAGQVK